VIQRALALSCLLAVGCGGTQAETQTAQTRERDPLESIDHEEILRRGIYFANQGDYVRAEQYLAAARSRGIPDERIIPTLMEVCVRSSRLSAAIGYAEPYLTQHPNDWALRILIASIQLGLGHPREARNHLERVFLDAPTEPPEAHYLLGVALVDSGQQEDAVIHFRRYAELAPEGPHADEVRGILRDGLVNVAPAAAPPTRVPVRLEPSLPTSGGPSSALAEPSPPFASVGGAARPSLGPLTHPSGGPT